MKSGYGRTSARRLLRSIPLRLLPLLVSAVLVLSACGPTSTPAPGPGQSSTCPAWTQGTASETISGPSDNSQQALAQYNAARVLETPRPVRSLYALTQRLVKHTTDPIACVTRTSPRNEQVGHTQTFWVVNYNQIGYHQVQAKLVYETAHLYMYVVNGANVSQSAIRSSADNFEQHTYQTDRQTYGAQWTGPDDDPHITVLHVPNMCQCGGYFSSSDEYPQTVFQYSNERQMIYANLDGGAVPGQPYYDSTLAHEFQHMIHWYSHPYDPSWVNEGMSVLAQHVNGYISGGVESDFLHDPDTMLGGWPDDPDAARAHYGAGYLFMDYFAEHYGGYSVLKELLQDPEPVPLNFNHVLKAHGHSERFDDVFATFVIANLVNRSDFGNGLYAYPSLSGIRATVQQHVSSYPFDDSGRVHQYATQYYDFTPDGSGARTLALSFHGNPYVGIVDNSPYNGASAEWWGNSANYTDTTLTRGFDLGPLGGKHVTLTFQAWYSLEKDFDYAYVEVSTDGGKTWHTVKTSASTSSDPNAANYDKNGITGISGSGDFDNQCGPTPQWRQVSADLSAYAGKQAQVRFETITDDGVHCPGLALDNVQIPELGFTDDVSGDNGWQAQGFIRSNNVLPQRYIVQAVIYHASGAPSVQRMTIDAASGSGQMNLADFGGGTTRLSLAVSATAPSTVVPAQYSLSAQLS
jgi:immune inhibitor A